jgi:hypothetical protein
MVKAAKGASVFDWLLGPWTFSREIPGYASVRGEASVTPEGENGARYEETATVSLVRGGTLQAKQCYLYRRLGLAVNGFEVRFCETGELFERLEFREEAGGGLRAQARFLCGDDVYESEYAVDAAGRLLVEHVVRGPRKDYRVRTIYSRRL